MDVDIDQTESEILPSPREIEFVDCETLSSAAQPAKKLVIKQSAKIFFMETSVE